MYHIIKNQYERCICCGKHDNNNSCTPRQIVRTNNLDTVNTLIEKGIYELFAAIPITHGLSSMHPYGDGSSTGSGSTSTSISYVLKKMKK